MDRRLPDDRWRRELEFVWRRIAQRGSGRLVHAAGWQFPEGCNVWTRCLGDQAVSRFGPNSALPSDCKLRSLDPTRPGDPRALIAALLGRIQAGGKGVVPRGRPFHHVSPAACESNQRSTRWWNLWVSIVRATKTLPSSSHIHYPNASVSDSMRATSAEVKGTRPLDMGKPRLLRDNSTCW